MRRVFPRSPAAAVAYAVLATRLAILLAGAFAVTILGTVPAPVPEALWRLSPREIPNMFARWDTFYYWSIAQHGYSWDPAVFTYQNVVFFPLYPLLMRWGGVLLGGHPLAAGVILSVSAFTGALVLLYRLAVLELGKPYAWRVILLISMYPYALFFSAAYTESLFLLATVGAFYAMRRGYPGWVAVCGLAAGLTRPNGFWLTAALACLALWPPGTTSTGAKASRPARLQRTVLAACAPLIGTVMFSVYLYWRFHDGLAWVHGQSAWGMPLLGRAPAPDAIPFSSGLFVRMTEVVVYFGNIAAFATAALAIRPVTRRLGLAYGLWIATNIFPPVAAHLFMSIGRFTSVLFPLFFWLAIRLPRPRLWQVAGAFAAAQAVFAVWFFLWLSVF